MEAALKMNKFNFLGPALMLALVVLMVTSNILQQSRERRNTDLAIQTAKEWKAVAERWEYISGQWEAEAKKCQR